MCTSKLRCLLVVFSPFLLSPTQTFDSLRAEEWLVVPPQSLMIDQGSPLDFSSLVPAKEAGSSGALALADGRLLFPKSNHTPRFNCAMIANGPNNTWDFPSHVEADDLADQLLRHGYNLVRFHFLEARLMRHATKNLEINEIDLDRFHYLLFALKKRGIYWMLDVQTAYDSGIVGLEKRPMNPDSLKIRLNFDEVARRHWVNLLEAIYGKRNPYTGLTTLSDPALAFVIGANENSLAFGSLSNPASFSTGIEVSFDHWARHRWTSSKQLVAAISDLTSAEAAGAPIALPRSWASTEPRMAVFLRFVADQEIDTYRWMTAELTQHGYHGPLLGYPEWYRSITGETRSRLPIVDIHAYLGEVNSYAPGIAVKLPSSTTNEGLGNWTTNAGARWLDRPMVASEYGIPIPNPYRYEGGVTFPALAAFQGYSAICRNANISVEPNIPPPNSNSKGLVGYSVGLDPTTRAAETLAALLFFRGDVTEGEATVAVPFGENEFRQAGSAFLPASIRRAALLARFGLISPSHIGLLKKPFRIINVSPVHYSTLDKFAYWISDVLTEQSDAQISRIVKDLRSNGTLSSTNITNPTVGLYQNQTEELIFDQNNGLIKVETNRTEAVSSTKSQKIVKLKNLYIKNLNSGALISASSLDSRPLSKSKKILFIVAGDAKNSGLVLQGFGANAKLADWGHLPILMKRIVVDLSIHNENNGKFILSTLSLSGKVIEQSAIVNHSKSMSLELDNGRYHNNPTNYFILTHHD